jgi:opine dehydrogenase
MAKKMNITVIGAGHGGKSMAAHLAIMGFPTTLYNRTPEHIAAIKALGVIDLETYEGGPRGLGKLACVTSNIAEALTKAEMIMVVVPLIGSCRRRQGMRSFPQRWAGDRFASRQNVRCH